MKAKYPILQFDKDSPALFKARHTVPANAHIPKHNVLCFFNEVIEHWYKAGKISEITHLQTEIGRHPVYRIENNNPAMVLMHPGIGAPLAAGFLEELIAMGGRKFIVCGGAGTLDASPEEGKLIIPVSAIRDEGTSYHYLPPGYEVLPSNKALTVIKETLTQAGVTFELTKTWTTDAIYRETKTKIKQRRKDGCGCVEMEAAALFAVAQFRNVEIGQILYAGDDLSGEYWDSRNWDKKRDIREKLLQLAISACCRL